MHHPLNYTHQDWARWFERAQIHTRVAPGLTEDLRSSNSVITAALVATAEASLAELDDDIIAGEFLAKFMQSSGGSMVVDAIVFEMAQIAQDLLQAIVEAKAGDTADRT